MIDIVSCGGNDTYHTVIYYNLCILCNLNLPCTISGKRTVRVSVLGNHSSAELTKTSKTDSHYYRREGTTRDRSDVRTVDCGRHITDGRDDELQTHDNQRHTTNTISHHGRQQRQILKRKKEKKTLTGLQRCETREVEGRRFDLC